MTVSRHFSITCRHLFAAGVIAGSVAAVSAAASAQTIPYGEADSAGSAETTSPDTVDSDSENAAGSHGDRTSDRSRNGRGERGGRGGGGTYGVRVTPYIEAAQIVTAEITPGNDVLTYSRLSAGVDATIQGRNTGASASVRYEHYFGWGRKADDADTISGIARGYTTIVPGVQIEAGALATRTRIESNGGSVIGPIGTDDDGGSNIYSIYAGPTVSTHVGEVKVDGGYRIGYTRVDSPDFIATAPGQAAIDVFDDSVVQNATVHAGVAPGVILPVGVGLGAGYYREDISNLDQRVQDFSARADVTVPLSGELALVGGVGYEDVEISSRDAVRDVNGLPVVGRDGRYITDKSAPRRIAFDADGLIWDAGVIWRPSRRTALEAHVGKRYGSTSYYGSFAYAPSPRSSLNVSVYDNVAGFGGQVNRALADLPTQFEASRSLLTGNINGCVASTEAGSCLSSVLGSVRSSTFRARGVMATYGMTMGRINAGIGAGYDRRKFLAAEGTILASANGVIDENTWLSAYLGARTSERDTVSANVYANWFQSSQGFGGDATGYGASAAYGRTLTDRLQATAALGIDGVTRDDPLDDIWSASALLGLHYSF